MNILISPLNWGIGHATRLVPVINTLKKTHNITIVADGLSFNFLEKQFPELTILKAPSLNIKYTKSAKTLPIKMIMLLPSLVVFYIKNKNWIKKNTETLKTDVIIADNRFGFFSKRIKSIFITHQIHIKANNKFIEKIIFIVNKINIERFDECWIPDFSQNGLSGELSSTKGLKIPFIHIGLLSRFPTDVESLKSNNYDITAILSGPEPQRSIFENKLKQLLKDTNYKTLIINGKIKNDSKNVDFNKITTITHADDFLMQNIIKNSEVLICRAGYSSIMDFIHLEQTAILIPTPGQTEQEYLASNLHKNKLFLSVEQDKFSIKDIELFLSQKEDLKNNVIKYKEANNISLKISL